MQQLQNHSSLDDVYFEDSIHSPHFINFTFTCHVTINYEIVHKIIELFTY